MSPDAWNTAITGAFVLASASLGFFGSLVAGSRAAKHSLEQVRYERVQARREEVLSETYALLWDMGDAFGELVTMQGTPKEKVEQMTKANTSIGLVMKSFRRGWPWIPEEIGRQLVTMAQEHQDFMDEVSEEVRSGPIDQERYAAVFAKAKPRYAELTLAQDHDGLLRTMRRVLGIEDPAS